MKRNKLTDELNKLTIDDNYRWRRRLNDEDEYTKTNTQETERKE